MVGGVSVIAGMMVGGGITAADVAAGQTQAQMDPAVTALQAFFATGRPRFDVLDLIEVIAFSVQGSLLGLVKSKCKPRRNIFRRNNSILMDRAVRRLKRLQPRGRHNGREQDQCNTDHRCHGGGKIGRPDGKPGQQRQSQRQRVPDDSQPRMTDSQEIWAAGIKQDEYHQYKDALGSLYGIERNLLSAGFANGRPGCVPAGGDDFDGIWTEGQPQAGDDRPQGGEKEQDKFQALEESVHPMLAFTGKISAAGLRTRTCPSL